MSRFCLLQLYSQMSRNFWVAAKNPQIGEIADSALSNIKIGQF